jgi:hypothetical protein
MQLERRGVETVFAGVVGHHDPPSQFECPQLRLGISRIY